MAIPCISLPLTSSSRIVSTFYPKYSDKREGGTGVWATWHGDLLTLEIGVTVHDVRFSGNRQKNTRTRNLVFEGGTAQLHKYVDRRGE
jgi:hypothetical protein